ncbi:hypothetical protein IQ13_1085 [Lacibacter cauensis]|uniref:Uncharacterized protein n=1 Tax=Lacibacter cauensis TaxID=510947 RepID=A0A562SQC3_9BACT|nr:hypothetical protein [Lacibacter cauensis]TWI82980.1 hypothetical protein IQ13_1085 [Lacibacter cauensis]
MKQLLLSILSLLSGLVFFLCSFYIEEQLYSLLFMALAVSFLALTIGILSSEREGVQVEKSK